MQFRGYQTKGIVSCLDIGHFPESRQDVKLITVKVNELESFALVYLRER